MRYRPFGATGLYVSEICLGAMTFGGTGFWEHIGKLSLAEAEKMIGTALDAGVNLIDTADAYGFGESEKTVGAALRSLGRQRDEVLVATKVYIRMGLGPNQVGLSRGHIFAAVDASLRRLKLDFIDLYQIHAADLDTPIEETVRALDDLVRCGKVRYVGFCNLPAWTAMKALAYADSRGWPVSIAPRCIIRSPAAISSGKSSPWPRIKAWRSCLGARWPADCSRASSISISRGRRCAADDLRFSAGRPPADKTGDRRDWRGFGRDRHFAGGGRRWPGCSRGRLLPASLSAPRRRNNWPTISVPATWRCRRNTKPGWTK